MKKWTYPLAIVTLIVFFVLRATYQGEAVRKFDGQMAEWLLGNKFIDFFHYIGEPKFVAGVAIILIVYLAWKMKNYRGMVLVLLTFAAGSVLNHLLKIWVQRPRPEIEDQLTSFSFPSGHSMSGLLYLFTTAYILSEGNTKARNIQLWIGAIVLTALIGMSRVAGARHFASDVLAGWSVGFIWFVICVIWYERRKRIFKNVDEKSK